MPKAKSSRSVRRPSPIASGSQRPQAAAQRAPPEQSTSVAVNRARTTASHADGDGHPVGNEGGDEPIAWTEAMEDALVASLQDWIGIVGTFADGRAWATAHGTVHGWASPAHQDRGLVTIRRCEEKFVSMGRAYYFWKAATTVLGWFGEDCRLTNQPTVADFFQRYPDAKRVMNALRLPPGSIRLFESLPTGDTLRPRFTEVADLRQELAQTVGAIVASAWGGTRATLPPALSTSPPASDPMAAETDRICSALDKLTAAVEKSNREKTDRLPSNGQTPLQIASNMIWAGAFNLDDDDKAIATLALARGGNAEAFMAVDGYARKCLLSEMLNPSPL